ncbi:LisH dimerization motif, subgroup [Penicillium griseofulvum]|uniref:LisH dimerization motif, subgroup n=1 Tax=Penicillium patulum TaxID=5078 RepID=A0A135LSH3_PENPA|nr:LisH dimerization motif, subgroup [Penicillium griseofulvum]KXG51891.1 LisH dimerization motif, subgroup [Penicillium griseofulvum]
MNVGMNPGAGGPVGGVPMINNGSTASRNDNAMNNPEIMINNLNTYIYDYFLKRGYHDCARALLQDESIKLNTDNNPKTSPGNRRDDVNGMDPDAMMTDGKDGEKIKIPDDLPRPNIPNESPSSFLLDWFSLFWEFFWAQRKKGNSNDIRQYLQHNQNFMRLREQQHNQFMRQQPMMPGQMNQIRRQNGGMVPPNLQKTVLQNNTPGLSQQQQQQMAQYQKAQHMQMVQQMQRDPDMEMGGHRPQSPASADNAPSPSKRPRLEGAVNGQQLAPNGRVQGQGMPGQPNQAMMMQNGIQRGMTPAQFQQFQGQAAQQQQKSMQVYAQNLALHHSRSASNSQGIPNGGMMNPGVMTNQADLVPMPDGQGMYPMAGGGPEYYSGNSQLAQVRPGSLQAPGSQQGNHALQDYQMQLMLLEQQNKRRLMMARQEQDSMARADGQPPMPGQGALPPGTSPGSRAGASPNPSDQMKRGTPKMPPTGLPGSPSAGDMSQRGSPGSMNLNGGAIPPEMAAQYFNGPNMRPPSSNPAFTGAQMGQPIPANAGQRMPSGQWQQGQPQMPPQHSPANQPQAGTPQERSAMPPPSAPPVTGPAGRGQPASPQTAGNAPPTPQQATKAAPKGKKDTKDARKRPNKKQAAAAAASAAAGVTASTEGAEPPTPSTPVTPQHPNSFNNKNGVNGANGPAQPAQPTSAPAPQTMVQPPPDQQQSFTDLSIPDASAFNLDFSALENPDILENFDFDTFLNTDADATGFGFDPSISYSADGVETGAGDTL